MTKEEEIKKFMEMIKALTQDDIDKLRPIFQIKDKEYIAYSKQITAEQQKQLEIAKEMNEYRTKAAAAVNDTRSAMEAELEYLRNSFELEKQKLANSEKEGHRKQEILNLTIENSVGLSDENEQLNAISKRYEEINEKATILNKGMKEFGPMLEGYAGSVAKQFGITSKLSNTFMGNVYKTITALKSGEVSAAAFGAAFKQVTGELFNFSNMAQSIISGIVGQSVKLFKDFDKASASLAATTGMGNSYNEVLYESQRLGNLYGISMDKVAAAIGVLNDKTSQFASLSKAEQISIGLTTAKLEKLGVSANDSANIFENLTRVVGVSTKEALKMQTSLAMAGVSIGVSSKDITKNFSSSLSTLAVYGKQSMDVFYGIQAGAKAANVEVSSLLNIAKKFDTFSGAAEGVAKFNALLGTQLSTTQMLMMTEDERIRTLVESVQAQGVAFKDMDKFTQQSIAAAAGISDMNEANRIFGMSLKEYDSHKDKLEKSADAQKKFDDAVAATVPVMDQFKALFTEIVVMVQPALEILGGWAKSLTEFFQGLSTETKEFIGIAALVVSGLGLIAATFAAMAAAAVPMVASLPLIGVGIGGTGTAAGTAAPLVGGFATSVAGLGAALTGAAVGLAAFLAPAAPFLGTVVAIAAAVAAVAAAIMAVAYAASKLGGMLINSLFGPNQDVAQIDAMKESSKQALISLDSIGKADFSKAITAIKGISAAVNEINGNAEVKSTIENLAQIVGTATTSVTNSRTSSALTTIQNNVSNVFSGMKMTLKVGEQEFDGYVESLVNA